MSTQLFKSVFGVAAALASLIALSPPSMAAVPSPLLAQANGDEVSVIDARSRSGEHAKAAEDDPSGEYRGYPGWAREALSPKN